MLTPSQTNLVRQLLYERLRATRDARESALQARLSVAETNRAVQIAAAQINEEIKSVAGPRAVGVLEEAYQLRRQPHAPEMRSIVANGPAIDLSAAGVPLARDQFDALVKAFVAANAAVRSHPPIVDSVNHPTALTSYYERALDRAGAFLSAEQMDVFRQYCEDESRLDEYNRKMAQRIISTLPHSQSENVRNTRSTLRAGADAARELTGDNPP